MAILSAVPYRNTPAYAGKTTCPLVAPKRLRETPRLRGEDIYDRQAPVIEMETPPLTRGRLQRCQSAQLHQGNTPAYAGKTRGRRPAGA